MGYLMCNFANKMQGVKEKATLWYSGGGDEKWIFISDFDGQV